MTKMSSVNGYLSAYPDLWIYLPFASPSQQTKKL